MLEWTGERYLPFVDPKITGAEIHYEHLHRYAFASQFVEGKDVLDLASGEGYGSCILSKNANRVVGVEIDQDAVAHARSKYIKHNLEFEQGSILEIPIEGRDVFDVIVCFEAIEHVGDHNKLLSEVKRLLKGDGLFIVSTPNKKVYSDDPGYKNPYHVNELYFDEFKYLLSTYFSNIYFLGQRVYAGSNIWPILPKDPSSFSEFVVGRNDQGMVFTEDEAKIPLYLIAVASNSTLSEKHLIKSSFIDTKDTLVGLRDSRITELGEELRRVVDRAGSLDQAVSERDSRIIELGEELQKVVDRAGSLDQAVSERDFRITELGEELRRVVDRAGSLDQAVSERDFRITELGEELQRVVDRAGSLDQAVSERDSRITELGEELQRVADRAGSLDQALSERDSRIAEIGDEVEKAIDRAQFLEVELSERDNRINELNNQLGYYEREAQRLEIEIQEMCKSIMWQLVMKYHNGFVERALPHGTERRRQYDLGLKGGRILVNEGCGRFWWAFWDYRRSKKISNAGMIIPPISDMKTDDFSKDVETIDRKVSIVIPTKNAGPDFEYTLEKIRIQKGIKEVQIIVIDSGSTDNTVKLAERYRAEVYSIKPEEFNHGETRNYGASKATGSYLLFIVQDAIPIGDYWLYTIIKVLERDEKIAAVTCRQVPRSDADLFACSSIWNHYQYLQFNKDFLAHIDMETFKTLTFDDKRKIAGLDNVCSCIRKNIFDTLKFNKMNYAEDLDFGIRLIERGYKICFLYNNGVVHSHNRGQDYFLRRSYVDTKSLMKINKEIPPNEYKDIDVVLTELSAMYNSLMYSLYWLAEDSNNEADIDYIFSRVKNCLFIEAQNDLSNTIADRELHTLLLYFGGLLEKTSKNKYVFYDGYISLLNSLQTYLKNITTIYKINELFDPICKLFAIYCGSCLGCSYYYNSDDEMAKYIDNMLDRGV